MHARFLFLCLALLPFGCDFARAEVKFEKDVLPIFTQYCFTCHAQSSPQLGLDLRTAASTLRGSHNGPVIVKGSPQRSLLWQKVSTLAMPPKAFGKTLPDAHRETLRLWIEAGAPSDAPATRPETEEQRARFKREVLPIFSAKCVQCHGSGQPTQGLDLRTLSSLLDGSNNGPVVVAGFSEKSLLVRKVESRAMPPDGAGAPLADAEIRTLRQWIDRGHFGEDGVRGSSLNRPFTLAEAREIREEERRFWSFRPPVAHSPPRVKSARRVRTPIDAFVLSKLESKQLSFSGDADGATLIRRAYFDLLGLPPTPEETRQFMEDRKADAYERLIDRLLASPQYGERWARHWLDAAGYVETVGKDIIPTQVLLSEGKWRYRDYVIDAMNDDKPWDRFLTEQIAGDELVDWRAVQQYTPEIVNALVATGYMRSVLDITDPDITNLPVERHRAVFKLVEMISESVLGLTMACARCHSHKYDPIPQKDYFRMMAVFTPAYNPSNWLQPKDRHAYTVARPEQEEIERHNAEIDRPVKELKDRIAELRRPYRERLLDGKLEALPEAIRADTRAGLETPREKRNEVQKFLVAKFGDVLAVADAEVDNVLSEEDRAALEKLGGQVRTWDGYRRKLEKIQALWDVGPPPITRLLQGGSPESPGPKVTPGFPAVLCPPGESDPASSGARGETTGLRLAFAQWLTRRNHPLTARVIVNQIWQHHFGRGIVETPENFGKTGAAPSHPELLDWLAVDFMDNGWTAKRLHKMIMISTVYRQSSRQPPEERTSEAQAADPDNRLLWRMNLRRLEAESLRDAVIAVSGKLNPAMGGPSIMMSTRPDGLQTVSDKEPPESRWRRSIYLLSRRSYPLTFLGVFDRPMVDISCTRRVPSTTPLQSLTMMNDEFVIESAGHFAERVGRIAGAEASAERKIKTAYTVALSREPTAEEVRFGLDHLEKQEQLHRFANVPAEEAERAAFVTLVHMLLSTNEFLYVD